MTRRAHELIDGYFDDTLSSDELCELSQWIKFDPENAELFARAALLHDRLRNTLTIQSELATPAVTNVANERPTPLRSWLRAAGLRALAAVLLLGCGLAWLWFGLGNQTASAAIRELDRIIVSSMRAMDRTYEVVVEDVTTPDPRGLRSDRLELQRPPKLPLDGARLYVRSGNQFVLVRKTVDGSPVVSGSNGQQSWSVPPRGLVKVSDDPSEFSRDLPGHETAVPLTNLHAGLKQLKRAYTLEFSSLGPEEYRPGDGAHVRLLVAIKKPKERGPQRVEIAYDSTDGQILRMRFVQMPYGPDRLDLRLSLLGQDPLAPDFFEHTSHHAPDRKVEMENRR